MRGHRLFEFRAGFVDRLVGASERELVPRLELETRAPPEALEEVLPGQANDGALAADHRE